VRRARDLHGAGVLPAEPLEERAEALLYVRVEAQCALGLRGGARRAHERAADVAAPHAGLRAADEAAPAPPGQMRVVGLRVQPDAAHHVALGVDCHQDAGRVRRVELVAVVAVEQTLLLDERLPAQTPVGGDPPIVRRRVDDRDRGGRCDAGHYPPTAWSAEQAPHAAHPAT